MSDCSASGDGTPCSAPAHKPSTCPVCGKKSKPVSTLTVKSLVRDHTRVPTSGGYSFCRTPGCDVVYFSSEAVFRKPEIKVRVGIKEREDPIPLCYCFDYTLADLTSQIRETGTTDIAKKITAEVRNGYCACEVKNPAGSCCLGDINRALQDLTKLHSRGVAT